MTKIVNVYIVYDLYAWPRNPTNNFKFYKNCLFGATSIVKNNDKEKYVYSDYRVTFNSAGSWSFDDGTTRNVIIFGVANSSSSHSDNCKNDLLILSEGQTFGINESFASPEKRFSINLMKQTKNLVWIFITMLVIVICLSVENESLKLKLTIKMITF